MTRAIRNTCSISSCFGTRPSSSCRATAILALSNRFFCSVDIELAPIGWQLLILGDSQTDQTAGSLAVDTFDTRLLAQPLRVQFLQYQQSLGLRQHFYFVVLLRLP